MKILGMLGTPELIIIAAVVLLLFGGRKLPELMKGLGSGIREFKDATNGKDIKKEVDDVKKEIKSAGDDIHKANETAKKATNPFKTKKK